jgi:hypothetical protein
VFFHQRFKSKTSFLIIIFNKDIPNSIKSFWIHLVFLLSESSLVFSTMVFSIPFQLNEHCQKKADSNPTPYSDF